MSEGRLAGKRLVLGVCGSIAAYKSVLLLRLLQKEGAELQVVLTPAAREFVGALTFSTLSRRPVLENLWAADADWSAHVHLGEWADLTIVAPATADALSRLARGACTGALDAVLLSARGPALLAPAMDLAMWAHPAVQANVALLRQYGYHFAEPAAGYLASGLEGAGRMAEPEAIAEQTVALLAAQAAPKNDLAGRCLLITAGPTQEPLDPVRYLGNRSTGKMGIALAEAAARRGAQVRLVLGPTAQPVASLPGLEVARVATALEMEAACQAAAPSQDAVIMCAAVADFRPAATASQKIKKRDLGTEGLRLDLVPNPDILAGLGARKPAGQVLMGFALETHDALENAQLKLRAKNLDLLALNTLEDAGAGFAHDTNRILLLAAGAPAPLDLGLKPKAELAHDLLDAIVARLAPR